MIEQARGKEGDKIRFWEIRHFVIPGSPPPVPRDSTHPCSLSLSRRVLLYLTYCKTTTTAKMSAQIQTTITPHNQAPYITRTYPSQEALEGTIQVAKDAQKQWAKVPLKERIAIGHKFVVCTHHLIPKHFLIVLRCRKNSRKVLIQSRKNSLGRWEGNYLKLTTSRQPFIISESLTICVT